MGDAIQAGFNNDSPNATLKLALQVPTSELDDEWEIVSVGTELAAEVQCRVKQLVAGFV